MIFIEIAKKARVKNTNEIIFVHRTDKGIWIDCRNFTDEYTDNLIEILDY